MFLGTTHGHKGRTTMKRMCDGDADNAGPSKYQSASAPEVATRLPPALAPVLTAATATAVGARRYSTWRNDGGADSCAPTAGRTTGTDAGWPPSREGAVQTAEMTAVINWQRQPITAALPHALAPDATAASFDAGESATLPTDLAAPDSNSGPSNMDGLRAQAPMPGEPDAGAALPWRRAATVVHASALGAQNVAGGSESVPLPQSGLTSRYRGVSLRSGRKSNPWKPVITVNNQSMHLGYFQSEEQYATLAGLIATSLLPLITFPEHSFLGIICKEAVTPLFDFNCHSHLPFAAAAYDTVTKAHGRAANLFVPQTGAEPAGPCVKLVVELVQGTCHGKALAKRISQVWVAPKPPLTHDMPCNASNNYRAWAYFPLPKPSAKQENL
ncbi:hypothetical protein T492DRAFT_839334 [Pavlovales sp. CCMP2436]|nr:hypothetical protein T492DRAFT_839334 [Pavlovales sp. CCMP2436]